MSQLSPLPDPWRAWIAENLLRGADPARMREALVGSGFDAPAVDAALADAAGHPYLAAARAVGQTLAKRDWLLSTRAEQRRQAPPPPVERIPLPSLAEFLEGPWAEGRPVVLTGALDRWPALHRWDFDYLAAAAGDVSIQIQAGRETDPLFDQRHDLHTTEMPLRQVLAAMSSREGNDLYLTARNAAANGPRLGRLWEDLGDIGDGWLDRGSPYYVPHLWLGPRGTRTPLHHDLNNILFAQIHGRKRFLFIHPDQTPWLYNTTSVYSQVDPFTPDLDRYPDYAKATPLEVEVGPGDLLFIPVGWWHAVEGLSASISVGFVHLNAPNETHHAYLLSVGPEGPLRA